MTPCNPPCSCESNPCNSCSPTQHQHTSLSGIFPSHIENRHWVEGSLIPGPATLAGSPFEEPLWNCRLNYMLGLKCCVLPPLP